MGKGKTVGIVALGILFSCSVVTFAQNSGKSKWKKEHPRQTQVRKRGSLKTNGSGQTMSPLKPRVLSGQPGAQVIPVGQKQLNATANKTMLISPGTEAGPQKK